MTAKKGIAFGGLVLLFILGTGVGGTVGQPGDAPPPEGRAADRTGRLEKARAESQEARQDAAEQRQVAARERAGAQQVIEALKRAEAALQDAELTLIQAKQDAVKSRYLDALAQEGQGHAQKADKEKAPDVKAALAELDREEAGMLQKYQEDRTVLFRHLQRLEVSRKQALADIEMRRAGLLGKSKMAGTTPGNATKLDAILERLDAIEAHLDRMENERARTQERPQSKPLAAVPVALPPGPITSGGPPQRLVAEPVLLNGPVQQTTNTISYDELTYTCRPGDTFQKISTQFYGGREDHAEALQQYNRNHPRASDEVRLNGVLTAGETVYIPPIAILEMKHGLVTPKPAAAGAPR